MGKGRAAGRVVSDFLSAIAGRVGLTFRRVRSGRVHEKWPVDNSVMFIVINKYIFRIVSFLFFFQFFFSFEVYYVRSD